MRKIEIELPHSVTTALEETALQKEMSLEEFLELLVLGRFASDLAFFLVHGRPPITVNVDNSLAKSIPGREELLGCLVQTYVSLYSGGQLWDEGPANHETFH